MNFRKLTCLVSVIISYSSNEKVTIIPTLSQSSKFSDDIVVSFGSHLLNGSAEDKRHIVKLSKRFPDVQFTEYQIDFSLNLSEQAGFAKQAQGILAQPCQMDRREEAEEEAMGLCVGR